MSDRTHRVTPQEARHEPPLHSHADIGTQATAGRAVRRPTDVVAQDAVVTSAPARKALAVLRIGFGLTFLWAFVDKLLALGFSTGRGDNGVVDRFGPAAWINGGSPTEGFLKFGADGPFKGFYNSIGGAAWADWAFMLGLLGIGLALTLGIGIRFAAVAGAVLYVMMWTVALPPANNPVLDDHLLGAITMVVLGLTLAGDTWGAGRAVEPAAPRPSDPGPAVTERPPGSMGGDTSADTVESSSGESVAPVPYSLRAPPVRSSADELALTDAWWRAANYLAVGQIYLHGQPAAHRAAGGRARQAAAARPLRDGARAQPGARARQPADPARAACPRCSSPARATADPGPNACAWLEGTYSELYSHITRDADGMRSFFGQFSFPGGVPSHCAPETPGSLHEGGELGYSLLHAYGAVLDNPDLVAFCVVGDGEAETGPLSTSWHCNTFVDPVRDGAVLPILHLNGYKIANPTLLARIPEEQLLELMRGYGYEPHVVSGDDPGAVHQLMAAAMDTCLDSHRRDAGRGPRPAANPGGPALADDRAAHPQGLDLPPDGRRPAGRGHLPRPPGAAARRAHRRRAPSRARAVDALLPAAGAVRRRTAGRSRRCPRSSPPATRG